MESFEIDLDSECVWLDDAWLTRDELVRRIKGMIEAGEFQIARPSQALESLSRALSQARALTLRLSPEQSDALNAVAAQTGRPVGALVREALASYLAGRGGAPLPLTEAAIATPVAQGGVATEPVNPAEAGEPVTLTPKRKDGGVGTDPEKNWFGK